VARYTKGVTTLRFRIGDAFPADDPIARFITVLAMISNDWLRLLRDMLDLEESDWDADGRRVLLFRLQAAAHHEAATFIADTRRRFPAVDKFIDGLEDEAIQECEVITGGINAASAHYLGDWIGRHRHVTFHYPEMHPEKAEHGKEEITEALQAAAELEGTITSEGHSGASVSGSPTKWRCSGFPTPTRLSRSNFSGSQRWHSPASSNAQHAPIWSCARTAPSRPNSRSASGEP